MQSSQSEQSARRARIPEIDGLRALAMLIVYCFHVWQFSGSPTASVRLLGLRFDPYWPFSQGPVGVNLFMVLSGFCLFYPVCRSRAALDKFRSGPYFVKRFRRIVLPYYAAIAYVICLPVALVLLYRALHMPARWQPVPDLTQICTHALFIHMLSPHTWNGMVGAWWSLGLEMEFYLAFPLLVVCYRRWGTKTFIGMVAISLVYRIVAHVALTRTHSDWSTSFVVVTLLPGRLVEFASGMWVAHIVAGRATRPQLGLPALAGALTVLAGIYLLGVGIDAPFTLPVRDQLASVAFAGAILLACLYESYFSRLLSCRPLAALALFSYSAFLIHQPTAWYLSALFRTRLHTATMLLPIMLTFGLALVLAVAYLFFLCFERPFLRTNHKEMQTALTQASGS